MRISKRENYFRKLVDVMKKIKVIHFVSGLKSGGVESMILNFAKSLENCKFIIVYQHEPDEKCYKRFKEVGCELIQIPSKSRHPFANIKATYQVISSVDYDIIHSHMNLTCWIPLLIAKIKGKKNR